MVSLGRNKKKMKVFISRNKKDVCVAICRSDAEMLIGKRISEIKENEWGAKIFYLDEKNHKREGVLSITIGEIVDGLIGERIPRLIMRENNLSYDLQYKYRSENRK